MTWYEDFRESYRPHNVRVLFVGESPPDPKDATRRFFYSPALLADNLFRGLMKALYDAGPDDLVGAKPVWLGRFMDDGFWLQDLTDVPLNLLSESQRRTERRAVAPSAAARILAINPEQGVIVCHTPTFRGSRPAVWCK